MVTIRIIKQLNPFGKLHDFKKIYHLLSPYYKKHWRMYAGLFSFVLLDVALTLAFAWFLGHITDAAVHQNFQELKWLVPAGILLSATSIVSSYFHNVLETVSTRIVKKELSEGLFRRILLMTGSRFQNKHTGELLTNFTQDLYGIQSFLGGNLIEIIRLPLIFTAAFIYMFHIHWTLSLLCFVTVPLAAISGAIFGTLLRRNSRKLYDLIEDQNHLLSESISGMTIVRSFSLEKLMYRRFAEQSQEIYDLELRETRLRGKFRSGSRAAGTMGYLISMCLGAYLVTISQISIGSLMTFASLCNHLIYPLTGMAGIWSGLQKSLAAVDRLSKTNEEPVESQELPDYSPDLSEPPSIRYQDMTFGYENGSPVFERFKLHIPAGKTIAIVGASGAGKTTLIQLLMGFYQPQEGQILLGDTPISRLTTSQLRSSIAYVPQESFLFSGTIRDNLMLARPDITEGAMKQACRNACIHDFIMSLPKGYDSEIGERGVGLSGGQKQRLSIARAILKDAPVLVLDEATSTLDSETEHLLQTALTRLTRNRTTLVIAHRLSTIQHADLIVVLEQGKIIQTGSHHELLSKKGAYRNLYHRQFLTGGWKETI